MKLTLRSKNVFTAAEEKGLLFVELVAEKTTETVREDERKTLRVGTLAWGKPETFSKRKYIHLVRKIVALAKQSHSRRIVLNLPDFSFDQSAELSKIDAAERASVLVQNLLMADFEFVKFKTPPKDGWKMLDEVIICGADDNAVKHGIERGRMIGTEVNACRTLSNTPGGDMTPELLAEEARRAVKGLRVSVKVLGVKEMKALKMGAILGMGGGSDSEPKFIILEYKAGPKSTGSDPIVLVGKGVTFDTGGLNLKPSSAIYEMHMDMSGGAAVIHAVALAARLGIKKNVIGLIPAVENMVSGSSVRPGDILRGMSGKTIEVLNTDAEGRVILSDALTYAERYNPRLIVDVATLTGASLVALGQHASAILTRDEKLQKLFCELGEESGDYVWPLPLWDEYEDAIKGTFADVANISTQGNPGYGGVINGAMFLKQFAGDYPWVHIDMAPRMTAAPGELLAKGAAGAPVRLLLTLIEKF